MKKRINRAIEFLLARGNLPILYWLKKDILEVPVDREFKNLQKYADRIRMLEEQNEKGSWCEKKYMGHPTMEKTHSIVETLRNLFKLYDLGCSKKDKAIRKGVGYLFSTQTKEGDFRGAYIHEYATTYHALILEIVSLFGFHDAPEAEKGFQWLMKNRQNDGGWAIPYRTVEKKVFENRYKKKDSHNDKNDPIKPEKTKPFSNVVTGMVLRALAASPYWRDQKETKKAGSLLLSEFFKADHYSDQKSAAGWKDLSYPFWGTNILSSLDSLSKIGFSPENEIIQPALQWLLRRQKPQGYWEARFKKAELEDHLWITTAVLRMLKGFDLIES